MPKISAKHSNQETKMLSDFTGGLNTAVMDNLIAENQLAEMVNLEIDKASKMLKTVSGTSEILHFPFKSGIKAAAWDNINKVIVVFGKNRQVYATSDLKEWQELGVLNGTEDPVSIVWEDGIIVASGGKLQYIRKVNLEYLEYLDTEKGITDSGYEVGEYIMHTLEDSPETSKGVFARSGRVIVWDDSDTVYYSGTGDEEYWEQDPNDPSTSLFLQIGYKVGGKVLGAVSMASDVLFIKDNGMVFRLQNEYPDWEMNELGRNIYCKGKLCYTNMGQNTLVLGTSGIYVITTTQEYGDMKPQTLGDTVAREIRALPSTAKARYVHRLEQVWFIAGDSYVLVYDVNTSAFSTRVFNSDVVDVLSVDDKVYVIKADGICRLTTAFMDSGKPLTFRAKFKTDFNLHDTLVKKVELCVTPLKSFYETTDAVLTVGRITLPFPVRKPTQEDEFPQTKRVVGETQKARELASTMLSESEGDELYLNPERLSPGHTIRVQHRAVFRGNRVELLMKGSGLPFFINYFAYDKAEV